MDFLIHILCWYSQTALSDDVQIFEEVNDFILWHNELCI